MKLACSNYIDASFYVEILFLWKDVLKKMEVQPALALPEGLEVTGIDIIDDMLIIKVAKGHYFALTLRVLFHHFVLISRTLRFLLRPSVH